MNDFAKKIKTYTYIGDLGKTVCEFALQCSGGIPSVKASDFTITGGRKDISGKVPPSGILAIRQKNDTLINTQFNN